MYQPTLREVKELARKIVEEDGIDYIPAFEQAKKELVPIIINAIISQLPDNIEHEPGDNFYPDVFFTKSIVRKLTEDNQAMYVADTIVRSRFARGKLDDDFQYKLYSRYIPWQQKTERCNHRVRIYDLNQQQDLNELIEDIIDASNKYAVTIQEEHDLPIQRWVVSEKPCLDGGWEVRNEQGEIIASGSTRSEASTLALELASSNGLRAIVKTRTSQ